MDELDGAAGVAPNPENDVVGLGAARKSVSTTSKLQDSVARGQDIKFQIQDGDKGLTEQYG